MGGYEVMGSGYVFNTDAVRGLWAQYNYSSVVVALVVAFVGLSLIQAQQRRRRLLLPPGPRPWPVVGNFLSLSDLPYRSLQKLATKYGGLMYLQLGSVPCVVVSTAAVAREIFQNQDTIFSSRPTMTAFTILFDGKVLGSSPYGPYWRHLRKIAVSELFCPRRHASYENLRSEEICHMMKLLLDDSSKGDAVNVTSWAHGVTANSMTRMLMNKRFFGTADNKEEKEDFDLMVEQTFEAIGAFVISDYVPYLSFITKLQGLHSNMEKIRDFREKLAGPLVDIEGHRKRALERGNDEDYVPDFVDVLLAAPLEDGKPLSDRIVTLLLLEMLAAGTDTSATTVEWAMSELIRNPHLIQRAQEELDAVVGADRLMQESDIPKLPFLKAIIKEAFRLHPAAPLAVPHESTQASEVLGYQLPAHTRLFLNVFAIHRDASVYENPDTFDPDRFVKEYPEVDHTSGFDSYQLVPFGVGRRMCPAYHLGDVMVHLMLGNLLHSFDWSLPKGESMESLDMSEVMSMVVCRKTPLCLVAKPRLANAHLT